MPGRQLVQAAVPGLLMQDCWIGCWMGCLKGWANERGLVPPPRLPSIRTSRSPPASPPPSLSPPQSAQSPPSPPPPPRCDGSLCQAHACVCACASAPSKHCAWEIAEWARHHLSPRRPLVSSAHIPSPAGAAPSPRCPRLQAPSRPRRRHQGAAPHAWVCTQRWRLGGCRVGWAPSVDT